MSNIVQNYEAGMTNRGNRAKIKNVFEKAQRGEKITVAFLGGSITMGSVASTPEKCYAYHVYEWWKNTFPNAEIQYVNAGIGATDSQFGCARVEEDVLRYKPDFVIVEYSVNDACNTHYLETYEGVVRKILSDDCKPAVMIVHNVCYDNGSNAQLMHSKIARYYQIPAVSMQSTIYTEMLLGNIENRSLTPDDLHPNDEGHALVASVITYGLEQILKDKEKETEAEFPAAPMTLNAYEDSVRYNNKTACPELAGFAVDTEPQNTIGDVFKNGWTATQKGASITFEIEGSCIAVQYRKTMQHPAPIAELILDGDEEHPHILDANFTETWGDLIALDTILEHGEMKKHICQVRLKETHENDKLPFYLVSMLGSGR